MKNILFASAIVIPCMMWTYIIIDVAEQKRQYNQDVLSALQSKCCKDGDTK